MKQKLLAIIGFSLLFLAAVALQGSFGLHAAKEDLKSVYEDSMVSLKSLNAIQRLIAQDKALLTMGFSDNKVTSAGENDGKSSLADKLEANIAATEEQWKTFTANTLRTEEKEVADKFYNNYEKLSATVLKPALSLLRGQSTNDNFKLSQAIEDQFNNVNQQIEALVKLQYDESLAQYNESATRFNLMLIVSGVILLIAVGLLSVLAVSISRGNRAVFGGNPDEVTQLVNRIAMGNFEGKINVANGDQTSILAGIKSIQDKLKFLAMDVEIQKNAFAEGNMTSRVDTENHQKGYLKIVQDVNQSYDILLEKCSTRENKHVHLMRNTITESFEEIHEILTAAKQNDLTKRISLKGKEKDTALLCTEVNELLDAVEGMVAHIKDACEAINTAAREITIGNADLAQRTDEQAASLVATASTMEEFAATVKQTALNAKQANTLAIEASQIAVRGGQDIQSVVTTMFDINSSASKIEDIISVIDGIAFQTNILALNAAVEAARAGEQGRGFAVVAGEVRNLAQRSATAAKEIKELINNSVGKTTAGGSQVESAGLTIEEVVLSTQRVADIIAEITAASLEQSTGIDQVNNAVTQMDNVTQQNAALVEQAAAAAESLVEQTNMLMQTVGRYNVKGDEHRGGKVPFGSYSSQTPAQSYQGAKTAAQSSTTSKQAGDDVDWELF